MNNKKARVIAFYLPQFHPVPENNEWWGPGFTEWHCVANAKPLYKGHHQPNIPADLGFYDLRVAETRKLQAEMAKEAGVEGFCYWHYWFGDGKRLLERPINEVLASGEPDFPFCFGWANHNWYQKLWDPSGSGDKLLIEQKYLGREDYEEHFMTTLLPAFKDKRYIQVDGKPLFVIYSIDNKEKIKEIIDIWRELALQNGLEGIYFVAVQRGETKEEVKALGFDAMYRLQDYLKTYVNQPYLVKAWQFLNIKLLNTPRKIDYERLSDNLYTDQHYDEDTIPTIIPNYDHTPRSGSRGFVISGSTPDLFARQVSKALQFLKNKKEDKKILFLVSWNEWGEGNYMEPDRRFGKGYIKALRKVIFKD